MIEFVKKAERIEKTISGSKVIFKKFDAGDWMDLEDLGVIQEVTKDKTTQKFLTGSVILKKLEMGILTIDGKPCDLILLRSIKDKNVLMELLEAVNGINKNEQLEADLKN